MSIIFVNSKYLFTSMLIVFFDAPQPAMHHCIEIAWTLNMY
jgi:hypothetical protein